MHKKVKSIIIACMVLLLGLAFVSFVSFDIDVASADGLITGTEQVTWDFYVVAGYNMTPTPPSPAPPPSGFNFTGDPPVYNFGSITMALGKDYLYEGAATTPTGSAYAKVNITNLLGQDIVITNLTAEVTAGTPTLDWFFVLANMSFGNYTLLQIDTLDPWQSVSPFDECNYTTGEITVMRDGTAQASTDWWTKAVGIPFPYGEYQTGPASLVEPDYGGDAALTNHTAPIYLAADDTFTEYFGIIIFGNATSGTQIDGTITLTLTYRKVRTPNSLDVIDIAILKDGTPISEAYTTWTVQVNVKVKNLNITDPINVSVTAYGFNGSAWIGLGIQSVIIATGANTTRTFDWDLADAPFGTVPVRAIAWATGSPIHYDELRGQITTVLWGDIDFDGDVDFFDLGKVILIYSGFLTGPPELVARADLDGDGDVDFFDLGKMILIYSGFL